MEKTEIYLKVIKFGVILIVFITPLLFIPKLLYPATFSKAIFFRLIVEIIFIFYLLLIFSNPNYRPKFSLISISIIIFFGIIVLTSLFGVNPYRSFWGTFERMEGLNTLFHLFIFFFILISVFKNPEFWLKLFQVSLFASFLISLFSIITKNFFFFFGNPAYLAFFLLFNVFFALIFFLKEKKNGHPFLYFFLLIVNSLAIIFSQIMGAILAIFFGLFFFALFYLFFAPIPKKKKYFIFGTIFLLVLLFSIFFPIFRNKIKNQPWVKNYPLFQEIIQISLESSSLRSRLLAWQIGFKGWKERFFWGWGWENYKIVFDKYFTPEMLIYAGMGFDRNHNKIFDIALMSGILGLLSYFFIFFATFYTLIKILSQNKIDFRLIGAIIAIFFAYFVNNLFLFDTLNSYILFFLIIGFIETVFKAEASQTKQKNYFLKTISGKSPSKFFYTFIFGLIILIGFFSYRSNIKPLLASYYGRRGLDFEDKDYSKALNFYKKSLNFSTYGDQNLRIRMAVFVVEKKEKDSLSEKRIEDLKFVAEELKKNIGIHPDLTDYESYILLGETYDFLTKTDNSYLDLAEKFLKEALKINWFRLNPYLELTENRFLAGKIEEALDFCLENGKINPEIFESYCYWNLGNFYLKINEKEKALAEFEKALEIENKLGIPHQIRDLIPLFNLYGEKREFQKLISLYEETIKNYSQISPAHPLYNSYLNLYKSLAATYFEIGEKEKARETALKLLEIEPTFSWDVQKFLEFLEKRR